MEKDKACLFGWWSKKLKHMSADIEWILIIPLSILREMVRILEIKCILHCLLELFVKYKNCNLVHIVHVCWNDTRAVSHFCWEAGFRPMGGKFIFIYFYECDQNDILLNTSKLTPWIYVFVHTTPQWVSDFLPLVTQSMRANIMCRCTCVQRDFTDASSAEPFPVKCRTCLPTQSTYVEEFCQKMAGIRAESIKLLSSHHWALKLN